MFYGQCDKCGKRWELGTASTCTCVTKREWIGLTDQERLRCFDDVDWNKVDWCPDHEQYAKAIEAKLKEKNSG